MSRLSILTIAMLAWLLPGAVAAQRIQGRVIELDSRQPIANVEIRAHSRTSGPVQAVSDSAGAFVLRLGAGGRFLVTATRIGFAPATAEVEVGADDQLEVLLRLAVSPTELPPLEVIARTRTPTASLERVGFYERKGEGFGVFLAPEDIERRRPMMPTDLLRGMNGIRIIHMGIRGNDVRMTRGEDPNCPPRVIVDRVIVRRGGRYNRADDPPFDMLIQLSSLAAMEIYRSPAETPREFGGNDNTCGVILMWTHRGGARL
ncbi:MAG TPA: carboxypeptidase-like regulatory domain-containing protein [Longimicrobiales bacterium]|nr:carboxypeptidase-like regulatory domain-containing protein [Longimicrobiales bacterium]